VLAKGFALGCEAPDTPPRTARLECFYEELDDHADGEVVGADWDEKEAP
jgi:hypothetical protein